jgi:hypothetical protein
MGVGDEQRQILKFLEHFLTSPEKKEKGSQDRRGAGFGKSVNLRLPL